MDEEQMRQQAQKIYDPQRDLALQDIQLANKGYDIQETGINRQYDTLGTELAKQADISTKALQEKYNSLGLLQSGMTAAGLGDIQSTLMQKKGQSEQDRADRLAQLALQRAGLTTKELGVKNEYEQNINDYVAKLMQSQQDQYSKMLDYALKIPQGQTIDIPGLGTIQGMKVSGGSSGGGGSSTTVTKKQAQQAMMQDISGAIQSGRNMDPNDVNEGGKQFFMDLYANYAPYGFTMDQIKEIAANLYGSVSSGSSNNTDDLINQILGL